MHNRVYKLVLASIFTALVFVVTYVVKIPLPIVGYVNIGDAVVALAAFVGGPIVGMLSGAIGSALADLAAGYVVYVPFTFVIKGIEGLLIGLLFLKVSDLRIKDLCMMAVAMFVMPVGYFAAESLLLPYIDKTFGMVAAVASLPFNIIQYVVCVIVAAILLTVMKKQLLKFRSMIDDTHR